MRLHELIHKCRRVFFHVKHMSVEAELTPYIRTGMLMARMRELSRKDLLTCDNETFESILRAMALDTRKVNQEQRNRANE